MIRRVILALLAASGAAGAAEPPHLNGAGIAAYRDYGAARDHRSFAIAPGGAWGWSAAAPTAENAEAEALAACRSNTRQQCVSYSTNGRSVFDAAEWPTLWGPYAGAEQARRAPEGRQPGERFPDLAFADPAGRPQTLASLKGKVVVLHFWASWCTPCRREMPDMQKLRERLRDRRDIVFVLLQAREPIADARRWAQAQGIGLPLSDSLAAGPEDTAFRLADGRRLADRSIAPGFPATYVIDKRGIVVFAQVGEVHGWSQYRDFLLDAARRSGR